jgi:hypothetical protein
VAFFLALDRPEGKVRQEYPWVEAQLIRPPTDRQLVAANRKVGETIGKFNQTITGLGETSSSAQHHRSSDPEDPPAPDMSRPVIVATIDMTPDAEGIR